MVKYFLSFFANWSRAKPFPSITNFLVTNPMFRKMAINYHKTSGQTVEDLDKWLEKELLSKEEYERIYSDKRIDSRAQGSTASGKKLDETKYNNKF